MNLISGKAKRLDELIVDRDYIFFCGEIFNRLLEPYMIENEEHKIEVMTRDNKLSNAYYHNVRLSFNGKIIKAGILRTYTKIGFEGNLVDQYGKKVIELYNSK